MISKKTFVEKVAYAINNNEIALFVAAGLSASTGQKNWAQMLTPCANALELEINENTDLYMIAQYYENEYGKTDLIHMFEKNINQINNSSSYLNSVLNLGFREIWTTNYDTVIEDNLKNRGIISKVIHNDMDLNNFTDGGVHIFKMNGDITNPHNMIVSKSDLEKYEVSHQIYDVELVCHYIDEIDKAKDEFPDIDINYSYDSKDYIDIYNKFDLVIGGRVHGIGMSASLGIPGIMIKHDSRSSTTDGFLATSINIGTSVNDIVEINEAKSKNIENESKKLNEHKKETMSKYLEILKERLHD